MKHTHPKKATIIAGLLSLCLSLLCPMAKGDNAIYTLHGRTLIINEGVKEVNRKDLPLQIDREITKVELPTSLQKIGNSTFAFCTSLKSINLPPSLTEIGDSAFYYCRNLKKIEIPNAVSRIGTHAFACCEGINQVIYYGHGRLSN
ncbi:MAG: leucine-rich repeat domain-containing protein [Paludibacteraceae bacterium]|nr:leucine-rich repeat domain-containing protein [Paludibacteraceae bacterium]